MPLHKAQKKKKVLLGDKVFAKVVGYPPWPARVTKFQKCEGATKKYHVVFYGTLQTRVIKLENLYSYEEYVEKCKKFFGKRGYKDAFISLQKDLCSAQQVKTSSTNPTETVAHAMRKLSTTKKSKPKLKADIKLSVKNNRPIVSKLKASYKLKAKKVIQSKSKHAGASKKFKKVLGSKIKLSGKLLKCPKKVIKASDSKSKKVDVSASKWKSSEKLLASAKKANICNKKLKNATKKDNATKRKLSCRHKPKINKSVGFSKKVKKIITFQKGITVSKIKIKSAALKEDKIRNEKVMKKQKQVVTKSEPLAKSTKLKDKKLQNVKAKLKSAVINELKTIIGLKSVKAAKLPVFKILKKLPAIQKIKKERLAKSVQTLSNPSKNSVKLLKKQRIIVATDSAQKSIKVAKLPVFKIPKKLPLIQKIKKKCIVKSVRTLSNSSKKSVKPLKKQRIIVATDSAPKSVKTTKSPVFEIPKKLPLIQKIKRKRLSSRMLSNSSKKSVKPLKKQRIIVATNSAPKSVKTTTSPVFEIPKKLPLIQKIKRKRLSARMLSNSSKKSVKPLKKQRVIVSTRSAQRQSPLSLKSKHNFAKVKMRAYKSEDDNVQAFSFNENGLLNHIKVKKPPYFSNMLMSQQKRWEENATNSLEFRQLKEKDGPVNSICGPMYHIDYVGNKNVKQKERAPLSVFVEKQNEGLFALLKYFTLIQCDLEIQACLPLEGPPRTAECLYMLDEVLTTMPFDELVLKKYPDFVQTVEVLCVYEGKLDEWNLGIEEVHDFNRDAREIRKKGNELFTIIKNIFGTDDDETFEKVFFPKVKEFKKSVARMSYEDLCMLVEDPALE